MTTGRRIRETRRSRGYTQEYLAELLGVSRQAVSKWEKGQTCPDMQNMVALSEVLGVSLDYLISGKEFTTDKQDADRNAGKKSFSGSLLLSSLICLLVSVGCYFVGLLSGAYTDMVTISAGSGVRVGIPLLLYGDSPLAVALVSIGAVSFILTILFLILAYRAEQLE